MSRPPHTGFVHAASISSFAFFPSNERKKRRHGRKLEFFSFTKAKERVATGLTAFSRASCACALSHATRSLACQPIITALATARVRASLSPRKAADQVNIANRCIVASVNSISRPTDPADSALSTVVNIGYNKSTFPFFYFARRRISPSNWRNSQKRAVLSLEFENYRGRSNGLSRFLKSSPFTENVDEIADELAFDSVQRQNQLGLLRFSLSLSLQSDTAVSF